MAAIDCGTNSIRLLVLRRHDDGTVEELTDSGKTEDWALEDMIPDQRATYNKYLEGRKALQEELKAAREKSTPKPVA